MSARSGKWVLAALGWLGIVAFVGVHSAADEKRTVEKTPTASKPDGSVPSVNPAVKPKPLSQNTEKALAYLVAQQHENGGWGQGGGWRLTGEGNSARVEGETVSDPPDLGNTCLATLALIRADNTPEHGRYAKNVTRAVEFICRAVEKSDAVSLYVTDVRDTQLQSKIGKYVDTFLAGLVMSELKGKMPAGDSDKRLLAALNKTVAKIERNQKTDGTFAGNDGWASILSQGLCSKFLNRAAQNSIAVKDEVLSRDFAQADRRLDKGTGAFRSAAGKLAADTSGVLASSAGGRAAGKVSGRVAAAAPSTTDAGVALYGSAAGASQINDRANTSILAEQKAKRTLASKSAPEAEKVWALSQLREVDQVRLSQKSAVDGIVRRLDDKQFLAGFGNNGGEEFLSYMNISETLLVKGGADWERWDKSISENLGRIQNGDGSWSGQHCITGRTFCTSAALLTLMADRAPVPVAAQLSEKKQ